MTADTPDAAVELQNVHVRFGGVSAVEDVTLRVPQRSVHALIGPNGAGKTTLLNVITRMTPHVQGEARVLGEPIGNVSPSSLASRGVARTFQHPQLVANVSALDNVIMGLHTRDRTKLWQDLVSLRTGAQRLRRATERAHAALSLVGLEAHAQQRAHNLSYGMRKTLELARALVAEPRLLLLDEPTAGLDEAEIDELRIVLAKVRTDSAVLVVAHHLEFVMSIADEVTVMSSGKLVCCGPPQEVRTNPDVIAVYTGVGGRATA